MKTFASALVITLLLGTAAPPSVWSVGPGGAMGGHAGGMGGGIGNLNPAGGGGMSRGGVGNLNPAGPASPMRPVGPFNRVDPIDREGRFDHGGMRDHDHGLRGQHRFGRFAYPVCFAYAYCPSPVWPCAWHDGYWTEQLGVDAAGAETAYNVWVPPGCY